MEKSTKIMTSLPKFAVNDPILLRNLGSGQWWVEGIITRQLGNVNFEVETERGVTQRHSDQIFKRPILLPEEGATDMDNTAHSMEKTSTMETSKGVRVSELVSQDDDESEPIETEQTASSLLRISERIRKTPVKLGDCVP